MTTTPESKFVVRRDFKNEWIWELISARGETIAQSGQSYKMVVKCTKSIAMAKEFMGSTAKIEVLGSGKDSPS